MNPDQTQQQNARERQKARDLSRQRTQPPLDLPGYEARQFLGAGAYGEVWVAVDRNTGRKVAIKFYTQTSGVDLSPLSHEVEKLVFLSADRYVVQLLDVGWDSDPPYYVMEFVDGGSLQQLLEDEGPLPVGEAVEMFREIALGLVHAHGKGVLHCDLKPANILLDQDHRPRLADFGQSRLSHEQRPALGTLFFMAPEQADLQALPDARWDVYAMGALLYCMLTGKAPYRSNQLLSEIDASDTLLGRLERYREAIAHSPPPDAHRKLPGVDRELADIVDRCLAVEPDARFPNVQSVLTALRTRDINRDRRPLLLLGLLGPLLFLIVLGLFGNSAYRKSIDDSDDMVRTWAHESSRFAAKFVAETVARRIDNYYRMAEAQAQSSELIRAVRTLQDDGEVLLLLQSLIDDDLAPEPKQQLRTQFVAHAARKPIAKLLSELGEASSADVASWFVTDAHGVQLASAIPNEKEKNSTVGHDYSRRAYFHGGENDFDERRHHAVPPIQKTRLSPVFRSEASGTWKVAISTPILDGGRCLGIIALTVELGNLGNEADFAKSGDRFVTLVDGRPGTHHGQILHHPLFSQILADLRRQHPDETPKLPDLREYVVPLDRLATPDSAPNRVSLYRDPLGKHAAGQQYARTWIAAQQPVTMGESDTGLVVLVQESYENAAAPVKKLGAGLLNRVWIAVGIILAGVVYLWYLVTRTVRDPSESTRKAGRVTPQTTSLHSMETLELPDRLRHLRNS